MSLKNPMLQICFKSGRLTDSGQSCAVHHVPFSDKLWQICHSPLADPFNPYSAARRDNIVQVPRNAVKVDS
jgi:hypothetical protein